jgi:hypothetical protein
MLSSDDTTNKGPALSHLNMVKKMNHRRQRLAQEAQLKSNRMAVIDRSRADPTVLASVTAQMQQFEQELEKEKSNINRVLRKKVHELINHQAELMYHTLQIAGTSIVLDSSKADLDSIRNFLKIDFFY